MLQHELVAKDSGANIGKAIIDHYADYLGPWAKDEQGRYIVETPAWTTPNAAGKTPSAQKPWWWPIAGGIDLGSNFVGLSAGVEGATVGGRAAFAASKAAAAEAGPTGKLLNAIREGQLAKLASEGTTGGGAPSGAALAVGEPNGHHLVGGADGLIFRGGNKTLKNLTSRPVDNEILSFRDSLSNSYPLPPGQRPVLAPGRKYLEFDSSKFPPGSVIFDHNPPGHVGVRGVSPEQLMDLIIKTEKLPQ
jgi:hypothetical protein